MTTALPAKVIGPRCSVGSVVVAQDRLTLCGVIMKYSKQFILAIVVFARRLAVFIATSVSVKLKFRSTEVSK